MASHSVAERVDPKLAERNPGKAIENQREALDEERMKVLRSKFVARIKFFKVLPCSVKYYASLKKIVINVFREKHDITHVSLYYLCMQFF